MNLGNESETIEFKESTSEKHEGLESIAAIINKHGKGTLWFGVKDNGDVKGQPISDSTIKDLSDSIFRDIEPRIIPTIERMAYEEKSVLKVTFSGTQQPYSAFGKFLTRVGTQNRKMSRDELIKMIRKIYYISDWEKEVQHSPEDIDDVTLESFYKEAVGCGRLSMDSFSKEALLSTLELLDGDKVLNAGYALFGKGEPVKLKLACYATDEKLTFLDLRMLGGNIYNLINEAIRYIEKNINWRVEIGERKRIEIPEVPIRAIREIIVNAFAHADYTNYPEIDVDIHPGKIVIFNPGAFPDDLTPIDFIEKNISSIKRNPLILGTLFRCKDVEQSGTGFRRMNDLCKEENIEWSSTNIAYGFMFEFKRSNRLSEEIKAINATNKSYAEIEELTALEENIYRKIKENCKIQKIELARIVGKSERTVQRGLALLTTKGYIKRIGNNQKGYWEILK